MQTIKVVLEISRAAAIAAGQARYGEVVIVLSDADVQALTPEQRAELLRCKTRSDGTGCAILVHSEAIGDLPALASALASDLWTILDARIAGRAAEVARVLALPTGELISEHDGDTRSVVGLVIDDPAVAAAVERARSEWADRRSAAYLAVPVADLVRWHYARGTSGYVVDAPDARIAERPGVAAHHAEARAELARRAVEREREDTAAKERLATAEAAAAEAARVAEITLTAAIAELVAAHGTDSQRARLAEGMLPREEALALARGTYLGPTLTYPRYERLTAADVPGDCDDCSVADRDSEHEAAFGVEPADELAEASYAALLRIRAAAGAAATVRARRHWARCDDSGHACGERPCIAVRHSALVTVLWGGIELSREYAL